MLILGSKSKARYQLLRLYNAEIEQINADIDESFDNNLSVEENVMAVAMQKAQALMPQIKANDILVCADTVCLCDNKVLTKPKDYEEAFKMIQSFSSNQVKVITGVYLYFDNQHHNFYDETIINFEKINGQEITKYLYENPEYKYIAGALSIEKISKYVDYTYKGSYSNIIGLPMERISALLYDYHLLDQIDYTTKEIDLINIYRSSVRVLPKKDNKIYLLKGYTFDLKETYYMSIGGGYHYFEDKVEMLCKEANEEGGLSLENIKPLINIAEYNSLDRFIAYNKLTLHAYYSADITKIGQPSYVEYENELLLGIEAFELEQAMQILVDQYLYFQAKPYPIAIITTCDLKAVETLITQEKWHAKN